MASADRFFAYSYAGAREKFLAAAEAAGLDVHSQPHPLLGRDGEKLAMDVARFGAADAPGVLLLTSACHGVEGFCGSGIQAALLADPEFHRAAEEAGVAVVYLHALNPYGFSWIRRTTHENVDLNRNFLDFSRPLPANPGYDELAHALVPPHWPPGPAEQQALADFERRNGGEKGLQQAVSSGQYQHEEGLFFGGHNPTWSHQALRHVLQDQGRRCRKLAWIDFHTGLGPSGLGERIFAGRDDAQALARARSWWGPKVTSIYEGSSTAALLDGLMWHSAYEECPQAEFTGIALEFGTVPWRETIDALRAEQWLENHPEVEPDRAAPIKQRLFDAFYTDTPAWREAVLAQGREVAFQACAGLAR